MHHLRTKSPCSKNKTKKLNSKKIIMIFTANHCDFCCCLLEMCGFTLVSATLSYYFRNKVCFLSLSLCTSTILEKDCSQRFAVTNGISISRAFLPTRGYVTKWWHQNIESVVVLKSWCWTCLCCSSLMTNATSGVNQTAEPLKLTHRTPRVRSNPV